MRKAMIALMLTGLLAAPALAKESPNEILLSLPQEIQNFTAEEPMTYEEPALGASRGYSAYADSPEATAVTVYVYDWGYTDIAEGISSEAVIAAKQEAMRNISELESMGRYRNIQTQSDEPREIDIGDASPLPVLWAAYSYDVILEDYPDAPLPVSSDLVLVGLKGYICKIRITKPQAVSTEKEEEIKKLIKTLLSAIKS